MKLLLLLFSAVLLADDRSDAIAAIDRFLQAASARQMDAAIAEFAGPERTPALRTGLDALLAKSQLFPIKGVNMGETGNSEADKDGVPVLYLFGQLNATNPNEGFTADLVKEQGVWRIVRFGFRGMPNLGSTRVAVQNVPKVRNNVNAMVRSESVIDQFMKAAGASQWDAALATWTAAEQAKPGKGDEIRAIVKAKPEFFKDYDAMVEGRSDFAFQNAGDEVTGVEIRQGTMFYRDGSSRRFTAQLTVEQGTLRIARLTLQ